MNFFILQAYATLLGFVGMYGGLRTDEAKYLLNIPYPHPPFLRSIFSSLAWVPSYDLLWRFIIASCCVHMVWAMRKYFPHLSSVSLIVFWLLSPAIILQSGTIMIAVGTALFACIFCLFALQTRSFSVQDFFRRDSRSAHSSFIPLLGLLWLCALLSSYQSILYSPLVLTALLRSREKRLLAIIAFVLPVGLLILYSLSNPFALSSMIIASGTHSSASLLQRMSDVSIILFIGGGILSLTGIFGILLERRLDFLCTLLLLIGYVFVSAQPYYAILFTPILFTGTYFFVQRFPVFVLPVTISHVFVSAWVVWSFFPAPAFHRTTNILRNIEARQKAGEVYIDGYFGHDWQFYSRFPIRRWTSTLSPSAFRTAQAFVCLKRPCTTVPYGTGWYLLPNPEAMIWVKD